LAGKPNVFRPYKDKEYMIELYVNKRLSAKECAELCGCHETTILRWLKIHGIEARYQPSGELNPMWGRKGNLHHNYNSIEKECPVCGKVFSTKMCEAEKRQTCSWECRNELWKRTGKQAGPNNPNWLGGYDYRRGAHWEENRKIVLERDGYKCAMCGATDKEKRIDVHHVIPYRCFDNDREANHPDNLICLCLNCHMKADRAYNKMKKKGDIESMAGLPMVVKSLRWMDKVLPRIV